MQCCADISHDKSKRPWNKRNVLFAPKMTLAIKMMNEVDAYPNVSQSILLLMLR